MTIKEWDAMRCEDWKRVQEARRLFRRGYAWIDAVSNVGLTTDRFPFNRNVTERDEREHDAVWSSGRPLERGR
jgi:hypothetical protein